MDFWGLDFYNKNQENIHMCIAWGSIVSEKKKVMKTFLQTKEGFLETLTQLKQLEGSEKITQTLRIMKERETGKLCYLAEEDLSQADLSLLKDMLKERKSMWEIYKQRYRESLPF